MAVSRGIPAVFLDKDGTLIEDVPYNVDPALICFAPGAPELLRTLQDAGYVLCIVSNQSGVGRGYFEPQALLAVEQRLRDMASSAGAAIAGFYWCPHFAGSPDPVARDCACRKPAPGLFLQAQRDFDIDLGRSWMIGDILDDVEAGNRAGVRTILIDNGNETEWESTSVRVPTHVVANLAEAAAIVIRHQLPAEVAS